MEALAVARAGGKPWAAAPGPARAAAAGPAGRGGGAVAAVRPRDVRRPCAPHGALGEGPGRPGVLGVTVIHLILVIVK